MDQTYVLPDGRKVRLPATLTSEQVNQAIGAILDQTARMEPAEGPAPSAGKLSPTGAPYPEKSALDKAASYLVPQNALEAGAMLGTMGAGGVAAKMGMRALLAAPTRILGGALGGEVGGQIQGAQTGRGAMVGGGGALVGEGLGAGGGKVVRSMAGMKGRINRMDAERFAGAVNEAVPPLRLPSDPAKMKLAVIDPDHSLRSLQNYYQTKTAEAASAIRNQRLTVPALGPKPLTLEDASQELANLGFKGFSGAKADPSARTVSGLEQRELFKLASQQIRGELQRLDPSGAALRAFEDGRSKYAIGRTVLRVLQSDQAFTGYNNAVQLNTNGLRRMFEKKFGEFKGRLMPEDLQAVVQALYRGGDIGTRDVLAPGAGRTLDAVKDSFLRGRGGTPAAMGALPRTLLPNLGSDYTGRVPLQLGPLPQSLLDALGQRGAEQMSEPSP